MCMYIHLSINVLKNSFFISESVIIPGTQSFVVDTGAPPPAPTGPVTSGPVIGRWRRFRNCCGEPAGWGRVGADSLAASCDIWPSEDVIVVEGDDDANEEDILDDTIKLAEVAFVEIDTANMAEDYTSINTKNLWRPRANRIVIKNFSVLIFYWSTFSLGSEKTF